MFLKWFCSRNRTENHDKRLSDRKKVKQIIPVQKSKKKRMLHITRLTKKILTMALDMKTTEGSTWQKTQST